MTIWQLIIYLIKSVLFLYRKVKKGMNKRQSLDPEGEADR